MLFDQFNRREFITLLGGAAAWPIAARAQQADRIRRIGMLVPSIRQDAIRLGLRDLGYVEGQNIRVEYRPAEPADRLPGLAAELVGLKVDLIVAGGSQAVLAAQQATKTIPIVMVSSDPIGTGFVASLARPGGNITGQSMLTPELSGKRLELLREIVAGVSVVTVLADMNDPPVALSLRETENAANALGIRVELAAIRAPDDFEGVFASAVSKRPQALIVLPAPLMSIHAGEIAALALKHRLPSIGLNSEFPKAGVLLSYGADTYDLYRRTAIYVDKILKGAKPADLPVQQPTKFELVINLKTAKALDLTIPELFLARADEVIE
jgi:putative tryptophan/tyrosine transport system substrate-binding protein